jgi:hypothetical protein
VVRSPLGTFSAVVASSLSHFVFGENTIAIFVHSLEMSLRALGMMRNQFVNRQLRVSVLVKFIE